MESPNIERPEDLGNDDRAVVKRWLLELKLADKREKEWRAKAEKIWKTYRSQNGKANSFNILWSNTETLRPAIYNSPPVPDVRKRYKDGDKLGRAMSEVLGRSLEYCTDVYDFQSPVQNTVLDLLLPGRGVARVRYIPEMTEEEVTWERTEIEHVQWDDFRMGEGKTWEEVTWVAFRHRLTREELEERFGEVGSQIPLDDCEDEDIRDKEAEQISDLFKTALVWEVWNKDERKVLFIAPSYKTAPVQVLDDPMNLGGFFPNPKPVYAVEDSSCTVPIPLYSLYEEQAKELDRISSRINKIINALKLRGVYDATITELSELMRGDDNDLIPAQNVTALLDRGGLEKAIWMLPIKDAAQVLGVLYEQREATKQVIYEITGISDILRGSTQASETATAQQIKSQWGNIRLKRLQAEVQRFVRDIIRIKAEIIAEKFQPETLKAMTLVKLPTDQEIAMQYQQAMIQWQQAAQMAQMQGQQPPPQPNPPPPDIVTWEKVFAALKDDFERSYRVDIETDSTIAASVESDMTALSEIVQAVTTTFNGLVPVVQTGALSIEGVKEIVLSIVRRAKLGNAVEDALDNMQPPAPPPQEQDNSAQIEQMRLQADQQKFQAEKQFQAQLEQSKQQQTAQMEQMRIAADQEKERAKLEHAAQMEGFKAQIEQQKLEFDRWKAQLDAETKILVAQISANTSLQTASMSKEQSEAKEAEKEGKEAEKEEKRTQESNGMNQALSVAIQGFTAAIEKLNGPKKVVRGPDGRMAGVE